MKKILIYSITIFLIGCSDVSEAPTPATDSGDTAPVSSSGYDSDNFTNLKCIEVKTKATGYNTIYLKVDSDNQVVAYFLRHKVKWIEKFSSWDDYNIEIYLYDTEKVFDLLTLDRDDLSASRMVVRHYLAAPNNRPIGFNYLCEVISNDVMKEYVDKEFAKKLEQDNEAKKRLEEQKKKNKI
mgnify:CR=1 FL=1